MSGVWRLPPWQCTRRVTASELGQTWPWGLKLAGIDKLHAETKGAGVKVAVLDSGVDSTHPDLNGQVVAARDFTGSAWGSDDRFGHGTHTAGTVAAADNGQGVIGLAPEAELLIGKVLGDDGNGDMEPIGGAIVWAVDEGANVITMSLNSDDDSDEVRRALEYAAQHGVLVCCSAGNAGRLVDANGIEVNTVSYPGKWTTLCSCVGAHDENGKLADFSSRGPEVDLLAPGVHVVSCWPGNRYGYLDGTSMSTPFVAGVIALLIAYRRQRNLPAIATQAQLEAELVKTAIGIGNGGPAFGSGHGLLNPKGLFDEMASSVQGEPVKASDVVRYPAPVLNSLLPGRSWELIGTKV